MSYPIARYSLLAVIAAGAVWADPSLNITCLPGSLPQLVGSPVAMACTALNAGGILTWSISAGALPPSLSLDTALGTITGSLADPAGPYSFTLSVTDGTKTGSQDFSGTTIDPLSVTCTPAPPSGPVEAGVAYSASCNVTGGTQPFTWSVAGLAVPPNTQITSSGPTSATLTALPPGAMAAYSFHVHVVDSTSPLPLTFDTASFQGAIAPAVAISTTSPLPNGTVGQSYSQTFQVAAGTGVGPTYTWSATGLSDGLTLSPAGLLSGKPTSAATVNFNVTVTDSVGGVASGAFAVTVAAPLAITTTSPLPPATIGTIYSAVTFAATGGAGSYKWSQTGMPTWLTLDQNSGTLSGATNVPPSATNSTFTVTVTDIANNTASGQFDVPVNLAITNSSFPSGTVNVAYPSQALSGEGGSGQYTWSVSSGALPTGLTLSGATISGKPTAAGTFNFTLQLSDSASSTPATKQYSITIVSALTITTAPTLPVGTVGVSYSQTLQAAGGTTPYTWSVTQGTPPSGLSLDASTGVISGKPTATETSTFTVQVKDHAGATATKQFTLTIGSLPSITTTSLPAGTVGVAYSATVAASGGTQPYTWSITAGSPPAGTSLNSASGTISGTPTSSGSFTFTVQVADSASNTATKQFTVSIAGALTITTAPTLPTATVGTPYSLTLSASGGTAPYTWSIATGSLPAGLSLSPAGAISGTPTVVGAAGFTAKVTDNTGASATKSFTLATVAGLGITSVSPLPSGELGIAYSQTLTATGGTPPYAWSITQGGLPAGLTLSANGAIKGAPSASTSASFTVQVSDSASVTSSKAFTLSIVPAVNIPALTLGGASVGSPYSQTLEVNAGLPPYTWKLTGGVLPSGLTLSSAGVVSGTPAAAGSFPFTAQVTDSAGAAATRQFNLSVSNGLTISSAPVLPVAPQNTPYSFTLQASGGTAPYSWSLGSSSTLPAGLALSPAGVISGSATTTGTYTFTVQVTDSTHSNATEAMTLTVVPALTITTVSLPDGVVGVSYSESLAATGGSGGYLWTITGGTLPTGLSLTAAGLIGGKPGSAGTFTFTVQVADSRSLTVKKQFSITITGGFSISTAATLPPAAVGSSYSETLAVTGGTAPYTWSLAAGSSLPAGLALSTDGVISGTPSATGSFTFTIQVTDQSGASANQQFTLVVGASLTVTTSATLPRGVVGTGYSQTLAASGGTPPYSWSLASGSTLPAGLALSAAGAISGTPTAAGVFTFTAQVTDQSSAIATQKFTLPVFGIATPSKLTDAVVNTPYSLTLAAAGGTAPYTWTILQGALPGGLTLVGSTGVISGTPPTTGTSTLTIQLTDSNQLSVQGTFTLRVLPKPDGSITGLQSTESAAQQVSGTLVPASYSYDITGQLTLAFQPDPALAAPSSDPAIQFSGGGESMDFTIPAGSTAAIPFSFQTGTVAGTITVSVKWNADGAPLPVPAAMTQAVQIARSAPVISSVKPSTTSSGFQVLVTAYSTTREVSQANLHFTAASGQTLQTTDLQVSLTSASSAWFGGSTSGQYGSQFVLTLPFTVSNGTANAIGSVSVQLVNGQGTSNSASGSF
ncbi:MAG: putative Ig domain-containing protein [Bryobacteraceae bacterium]